MIHSPTHSRICLSTEDTLTIVASELSYHNIEEDTVNLVIVSRISRTPLNYTDTIGTAENALINEVSYIWSSFVHNSEKGALKLCH